MQIPTSPPKVNFYYDGIDDEANEENHNPLNSFLAELMEDVGIYLTWRWEFIRDGDVDSCQIADQLDDYVVPLSLVWFKEESIASVGLNADKVKAYCEKERHEVRRIIEDYCKSLLREGLPIMENYFVYTD